MTLPRTLSIPEGMASELCKCPTNCSHPTLALTPGIAHPGHHVRTQHSCPETLHYELQELGSLPSPTVPLTSSSRVLVSLLSLMDQLLQTPPVPQLEPRPIQPQAQGLPDLKSLPNPDLSGGCNQSLEKAKAQPQGWLCPQLHPIRFVANSSPSCPQGPSAPAFVGKGGSRDFKTISESSWQKTLPRRSPRMPAPPTILGHEAQFQAFPDVEEPPQGLYLWVQRCLFLPCPTHYLLLRTAKGSHFQPQTICTMMQSSQMGFSWGKVTWGKGLPPPNSTFGFSVNPWDFSK